MDEFQHFWLEGDSLAPPCQSEDDIISSILELTASYLHSDSTFYDLGCGDGRAATQRFSCFSVGVEIEEYLIDKFNMSVSSSGLESKIKVVHGDLQLIELDDASVISIYLLPESIELIKEKLLHALARGCVIVCNTWGIKGLNYSRIITVGYAHNVTLYLYDQTSISN